ncbi:MAG: HlyD family type I secretion periplasmic adaptor subunit [Nitratireductor sp.]|uniref:HlyD family type I secretion periplasmic adaptor subunit n=1 Tax=Nitratireductor sp. TaxID=1872084 RepID=UPI0026246F13|nr:HlyD family type I secretion periplasmic adaptor subunit [Nitratireductor sp.]MCV0350032.1 HlyD family type I secretion periplasmic adaptor subunit [Nitratireductor sp.]
MSATDELDRTSPTLRITALFTSTVFLIVLVASCVLRVEITARGTARIVPVDRVQVVQPEYPGAITQIRVRNGAKVAKGDFLISLDATPARAERMTLIEEETRLGREDARLAAFLAGIAAMREGGLPLPPDVTEDFEIDAVDETGMEEQKRLLSADLKDFADTLRRADARIEANSRESDVIQGRIAQTEAALEIQNERLQAVEKLLKRGAVSRSNYLDVRKLFDSLENDRIIAERQAEQKQAEAGVLQAEWQGLFSSRSSATLKRRDEIALRLAVLRQKQRALKERIAAAALTAPVSGTVEQLQIATIGGVVQAGQELLRIVPSDSALELEALFSNEDSGFLEVGQKVRVRLDAYPAERFGSAIAEITDIATDSIETGSSGRWGFAVSMKPEVAFLQSPSGQLALRPGMTASVDAITGERRLISYFIAPITAQFSRSLGER